MKPGEKYIIEIESVSKMPKTDSVVNTDFLFTALQQQVENNTKLVQIVVDLTHRLEQSAVMIDGLNHTIISLAKGETST